MMIHLEAWLKLYADINLTSIILNLRTHQYKNNKHPMLPSNIYPDPKVVYIYFIYILFNISSRLIIIFIYVNQCFRNIKH